MDNQPDEPEVSASLAAALERRFGADYRIVTDPSSTSALERLDRARDRGEEGALLVADQWMPEMTGIEWSTRTRELYPRASRCVMVPRYYAWIRSSRRSTKRNNRMTRTALATIQIHLNQPSNISVTSPPSR